MADIRIKHTDIDISGVYKGEDVEALTGVTLVALRSGSYDLPKLIEALRAREGKLDIVTASAEDAEDSSNSNSTAEVTSDIFVKLGPLSVSIKRRWLNIDALAASATRVASRVIEASAEQTEFAWEEVTGESILATVNEHGGNAVFEVDRESGVILSIQASFYDPRPASSMLGLVEAAATPKKIVGDLAQTSILNAAGTEEQVFGLVEWTIDWKRKTVEATTTDDATYESSLGSTKSWTAKAKFMYIDGDASQQDAVLASVDSLQLDAVLWNFFPTVEIARALWQGYAIIDGITIASGMGKVVGLDVSLKGTGPLKRLAQIAPVANNTVTGQQAEV